MNAEYLVFGTYIGAMPEGENSDAVELLGSSDDLTDAYLTYLRYRENIQHYKDVTITKNISAHVRIELI